MLTGCAARVQSMLSRDSRLGAAPLSAAGTLAERRGIGTIGNCDCCVRSCSFWPANPLKRGWLPWSRDVLHEQHRSHYRTAEQCGEHRSVWCLPQIRRWFTGRHSGAVAARVTPEDLGIDEVICPRRTTLGSSGMNRPYRSSGPPHVVRLRPGPVAGGHSDLGACRRSGDGQNVSGRANLDGSAGVHEGFQQLFSFTTPEWT